MTEEDERKYRIELYKEPIEDWHMQKKEFNAYQDDQSYKDDEGLGEALQMIVVIGAAIIVSAIILGLYLWWRS